MEAAEADECQSAVCARMNSWCGCRTPIMKSFGLSACLRGAAPGTLLVLGDTGEAVCLSFRCHSLDIYCFFNGLFCLFLYGPTNGV